MCSPLYQQDRHSSRYVSHRGRVYPPGRNYHHNYCGRNGLLTDDYGQVVTTRRKRGVPHTSLPNLIPTVATAGYRSPSALYPRIHALALHTYLKPIAPPRAPYHWLLPQFLAQWYTLARVHLLFRSPATEVVAAAAIRARVQVEERERERGRRQREQDSGGEVGERDTVRW